MAAYIDQSELMIIQRQRSSLVRIAQDVSARRELSIFGAKDWLLQKYTQLSDAIDRLRERNSVDSKVNLQGFRDRLVTQMFPQLDSGIKSLIYLLVAFHPDYFGMPLSQLTFLESAIQEIYFAVTSLQRSLGDNLIRDMFKIRNLFECMAMKSKVSRPLTPATYISQPNGMKIQVKNMSFSYHKDCPPALSNVNFTIEPGEVVSIVGYNGSGFLYL